MKRLISIFILSSFYLYPFAADKVFNIWNFGAKGVKTDDASAALTRAIDSCKALGGGTVYIPSGDYRCLPITLYDNITLFIDAGATLFVDLPNPSFKGRSFIYAENAKNITIKGKGSIDGQAKYEWVNYRGDDVEITKEIEIARQAGIELKRSYRIGKSAYTMIFKECENITIENITLLNSSLWCMWLWGCNGVNIHGIKINSDLKYGVNSDGIDLDATSNVHIYSCDICTGDDAIVIKTGSWEHKQVNNIHSKIEEAKISENIIVDNCILTSSSTALMIGTETNADVRHVMFSNCLIRDSNKGFGINVQDGGTVSDIMYSNISISLKRREWFWWGDAEAFYFVLKKRLPESREGAIRNIILDNITANVQGTSRIISTIAKPIENISISNLNINMESEITADKRASDIIKFEGVENISLRNIDLCWSEDSIAAGWRSAISMSNVNGFELSGVKARQGLVQSELAAIAIANSSKGNIFNCTAKEGTRNFLSLRGVSIKKLIFRNNFTGLAVKPYVLESGTDGKLIDFE